ncbi:EAL domain-containing protein [Mesorhizobium sp. BAC0120]|uniref:EAL domain-containing protein n=1 Tax=Mesorhizobium sp. BAC0120 TaxID=3090670 RepID=UPI00298C4BA4|nr:EAL domain-containing protein [Mesorhizobium sp. BAC0120]MDW6024086.1 EAL domain-containing protein [Mesorhizobium sp. BAC0120]
MLRLAIAGVGAALLCAATYLISRSPVGGYLPDMEPIVTLLALVIALVAAAVALRATMHLSRLRADVHLLARSIDMALRDVSERTDKDAATLGDMADRVMQEMDKLSERVGTPDAGDRRRVENAGNVVPHPSVRGTRGMSQEPVPQASSDPGGNSVAAAYKKAIDAGKFEIALQPIVSVSGGAAIGFDVYASLPLEGGERIELGRPAKQSQQARAAAFERILLTAALQAGRKRPGAVSLPLHVAISEALLSHRDELGGAIDLLQSDPNVAQLCVLSVPAHLSDRSSRHRQALDLLAATGVGFAVEGWNEADGPDQPSYGEAAYLKLSVDRLLDRERQRRKLTPAMMIVEQASAAKLAIIATKVATDEDAVALLDLGIDLMSGPRFGGPKLLKPEAGNRPGRLARS